MTSEEVHWVFGGAISVVALALLATLLLAPALRRISLVVPSAVIIAGLTLLFDLWLHGDKAPAGYAAKTTQHMRLNTRSFRNDRSWLVLILLFRRRPAFLHEWRRGYASQRIATITIRRGA